MLQPLPAKGVLLHSLSPVTAWELLRRTFFLITSIALLFISGLQWQWSVPDCDPSSDMVLQDHVVCIFDGELPSLTASHHYDIFALHAAITSKPTTVVEPARQHLNLQNRASGRWFCWNSGRPLEAGTMLRLPCFPHPSPGHLSSLDAKSLMMLHH
jgi:hypothetical protein